MHIAVYCILPILWFNRYSVAFPSYLESSLGNIIGRPGGGRAVVMVAPSSLRNLWPSTLWFLRIMVFRRLHTTSRRPLNRLQLFYLYPFCSSLAEVGIANIHRAPVIETYIDLTGRYDSLVTRSVI